MIPKLELCYRNEMKNVLLERQMMMGVLPEKHKTKQTNINGQ